MNQENLWKTAFRKYEMTWSVYHLTFFPQMLLGPFLNTLTHMFTVSNKDSERSTIKVVLESILMNPGSWYC